MFRYFAIAGAAVAALAEDATVTLHKAAKCHAGHGDVTVQAPNGKCIQFPGEDIWWSVTCDGKDQFAFWSDKECKTPLTKAIEFKDHTCVSLDDSSHAPSDSSSLGAYGSDSSHAAPAHDSSSSSHKPKKVPVKVKVEKPQVKVAQKKNEVVEKRVTAKCQLYETKKITQLHYTQTAKKNVRYETRKIVPAYASISVACPVAKHDSSNSHAAVPEDTSSSSSTGN